MTDLHTRFRTLDRLSAPDLWDSIEERAAAMQPTRGRNPWLLVAVTLLLTLIIGGAALVGSGIIKLPAVVDASASPSATADASADPSADASASPVEPVPASWTATGNMTLDRAEHTATLLSDGTVLVTGSVFIADGGPPSTATELYDPDTGTWSATGSMTEGRLGHQATLLADGRVLVTGGGSSGDGDRTEDLSAELYDPASGTWTATGSMLEAGGMATLLLDGRVLVAGGGESGNSAQLYDPVSETWTATGSMTGSNWGTATLLLDGRLLVTSGDGTGTGSAALYDPETRTWTATGNMVEARAFHSATLLPDGTVLVAGGLESSGRAVASAELYDPARGTWTATGNMVEARHDLTATRLADGRVLVTGGGTAANEVYDPVSGTWTATARMIEGRDGHTATLLSDGTVLVVGGYDIDAGGSLTSAELYDPGSGT